jgi:DinB superfamily
MEELEQLATRLEAARDRLRAVPISDSHEPGPPDPKTGERWDRFNILGHTAEMLPFWSAEIRKALDTGARMGREPGSSSRLEGIETGRLLGEASLRDRIEKGVAAALGLVRGMAAADLDREIDAHGRGTLTVRYALETFLVVHLEDHVAQLAELG